MYWILFSAKFKFCTIDTENKNNRPLWIVYMQFSQICTHIDIYMYMYMCVGLLCTCTHMYMYMYAILLVFLNTVSFTSLKFLFVASFSQASISSWPRAQWCYYRHQCVFKHSSRRSFAHHICRISVSTLIEVHRTEAKMITAWVSQAAPMCACVDRFIQSGCTYTHTVLKPSVQARDRLLYYAKTGVNWNIYIYQMC